MDGESEKRRTYTLTHDQLVKIAEQGAQQAFDKMTKQVLTYVGKSVLERFFWILGVMVLGLYFWAQSKGIIK